MSQQDVRQAILQYQQKHKLPDYVMCNILCMDEIEWQKFRTYGTTLTVLQQLSFIMETNTPLPD